MCMQTICYIAYTRMLPYSAAQAIANNSVSGSSRVMSDGDNDLHIANIIYMHIADALSENDTQVPNQRHLWIKPGYFAHLPHFTYPPSQTKG